MNNKRIISLLGMAQKAGKLASGEFAAEKAVKAGKAKLLLIADDSSETTKKAYKDMAAYYQVQLYEILSKQELGESIGKVQRAAVAVLDTGFSKALLKLLSE
jgi:ribosomal protein L7Ae-like RNA K-turn-binding protein